MFMLGVAIPGLRFSGCDSHPTISQPPNFLYPVALIQGCLGKIIDSIRINIYLITSAADIRIGLYPSGSESVRGIRNSLTRVIEVRYIHLPLLIPDIEDILIVDEFISSVITGHSVRL